MRAGTVILAISGAVEERKSHELMIAVMSSMDPNEAAKALKKFTASPLGVSDRFKRRLAECILPSALRRKFMTVTVHPR